MFAYDFRKSNGKNPVREKVVIFFISMKIDSKRKKNKKNKTRIEGEHTLFLSTREAFYAPRQCQTSFVQDSRKTSVTTIVGVF
jgi:hypothetical protein